MDSFNRRDVVKMGAAGAAGVAIAGLTTRGSGGVSAAGGTSGVHIHGTVTLVDDMPSGSGPGQPKGSMAGMAGQPMGGMARMMEITHYMHVINIDVFGPDSDLSGSGWGATANASDPKHPTAVDGLQCFYTQRGSIQGDIVKLTGRMLFSGDPGDPGGTITTEANLATGTIKWTGTLNKSAQFVLETTGVVMRI
jgi:hypothetical protein